MARKIQNAERGRGNIARRTVELTFATLSAQMRSADRVRKRLLFRVDRTYRGHYETDAFDPKRIWQIPSLDYLVGAGEDRRRHCETIQKPIFRLVSCWTLLGSFASGATMRASPAVSLCPPFCQAGAAHRTASISLTTCSAASPSAAIAAANRTAAARIRGSSSTRRIAVAI